MPTPTLADVLDYLGDTLYTDDQVQAALVDIPDFVRVVMVVV